MSLFTSKKCFIVAPDSFYWPLFLLAMLIFSVAVSSATETDRGIIRVNNARVCLNHCDDYYLELDDSAGVLILNGLDLPLYINSRVEVTGSRGTCNACPVLHVTNITRLSATGVEKSDEQPGSTDLQQNYPNPFNPKTDFRFQLADISKITLKIYDVLGREITTLVNEKLLPGVYHVSWDANGVASGVYYYRLQTQNFVSVKKMILLR